MHESAGVVVPVSLSLPEGLYLGARVGRPFPASVQQRNPLALPAH